MVQAPAKARSDVEILIEKFNEWADDRIIDYSLSSVYRHDITALKSAKANLKRLAEEIANERD